jgi:hypothetical protein
MLEPDDLVLGICTYINFKIKKSRNSQHFFYVANNNIGISDEDLKSSISYFITKNIHNINCIILNDIVNDFKILSGEEKASYFSTENVYLIDCFNSDRNSLPILTYIHDISKHKKMSFIYFTNIEKMKEYISLSPQYLIKGGLYNGLDKEIFKYYEYNTLKAEINNSADNKTSIKRNKL